MADRPILFSAPMVRALIDGRKTQTRRIIKPRAHASLFSGEWTDEYVLDPGNESWRQEEIRIKAGDRLWVKETWRTESRAYNDLAPSEMGGEEAILYDADADWADNKTVGKTRVSIHMTRWASRLTLTVTGVKVERLQDISEDDAAAEGWPAPEQRAKTGVAEIRDAYPIGWYAALWDSINGRGAWDANPWVIAYSFRVQMQNIDQIARAA